MSLRIERISVRNLGPLSSFDEGLADLNLFYGLNESGKTYLVEFLISTLFKKVDYWKALRVLNCQGRVVLRTSDGKTIELVYSRGRKKPQGLGDILSKDGPSVNLPLLKTLIVRAGDVRIGHDGISKDLLKDVFFQRNFYTEVYKNIPSTVQKATIEPDGTIRIDKRGSQQKDRITEELKRIDALIEELQRTYDRAKLRELEIKRQALEGEIAEQIKAKRHRAYILSEEIKGIEKQLDGLPDETLIERIQRDIDEFLSLKRQLQEKTNQLKSFAPALQELNKVQEALEVQKRARAYRAWCLSREVLKLKNELQKTPSDILQELQVNYSKLRDLEP
ncbi:MAG: hypothetical protein D6778_10630, partial [Nitrospirae bacterium]